MKRQNVIISEKYKIAYFSIPKCACTSIKYVMYFIQKGHKYVDEDLKKNKHIHTELKGFLGDLKDLEDYLKFAVFRDPVKRVLSCYGNRVIHHGDLKQDRAKIEDIGLKPEPDLNYFCQNLELYQKVSKSIKHHTQHQKDLVPSLEYLSYVYKVEELDDMGKKLSQITSLNIEIPHLQTRGPKFKISDLEYSSIENLINIYEKDYAFLEKYYDSDSIWQEYKKKD